MDAYADLSDFLAHDHVKFGIARQNKFRANSETILKRRLRQLGHILRMPHIRIPNVALRWTPQGKKMQGRPKATWRRTVEKEIKAMGLTCGEAEIAALDRNVWRQRGGEMPQASCSVRSC